MTFDRVFRNTAPAGYKGRICRIIKQPRPGQPSGTGKVVFNSGNETVAVEFQDGEQLRCMRSAVIPVASRLGRQTLANVARGGRSPSKSRRANPRT